MLPASGRSGRMDGAAQDELRIDASGTIPHETIGAFRAWDGHGCSGGTHRGYVRRVQQVFEEGVARFGLWPQSTLAEAVQQLKGSRMDVGGFYKASLKKLILFLKHEGGNPPQHLYSAGSNDGSSGGSLGATAGGVRNRSPDTAVQPAPKRARHSPTCMVSPKIVRNAPPDRLVLAMEDLLRWIASQEEAAPFRAPVAELYTPAQIPGYDTRVKRRMDLRTIGQKLARQEYHDAGVERFRADVCLCFQNCISYVPNPSDPFFRRALSCLKRFETRFAERTSEIHTNAQGETPINVEGCRRPTTREQRRVLQVAARRGGGRVLLPFLALSEYYRPDPHLVCMPSLSCTERVYILRLLSTY
jgi:hypothetical protein